MNIPAIFLTFFVLKFFKFNSVNPSHLLNIYDISTTLLVSKCVKSKLFILIPSNIWDIFLAFPVLISLKFVLSISSEANVYEKSSTFSVSNPVISL